MTLSKAKKVFVGLSGGVDSSVSALLLKRAGYEVHGVFIKVWQPDFFPCTSKEDRQDAMRVCAQLDIPFTTLDLEEVYRREVVEYVVREYKGGRTPNPDVMCNQSVKFGAFLKYALSQGADYVATGHYAQIADVEGIKTLLAGADPEKDQSYFLWTITQAQLRHVLFPVGHLLKSQVRAIARRHHLSTAEKKDSQGLCFLGKLDMSEFLAHFVVAKPGAVLNEQGAVIGEHRGAIYYVLGERHGFRVTSREIQGPWYVVAKDMDANTITVASKERTYEIAPRELNLSETNWIGRVPQATEQLHARTRYREKLTPCRVSVGNGREAYIAFEGLPPLAPLGQSAVVYEKRTGQLICRGGGVIT